MKNIKRHLTETEIQELFKLKSDDVTMDLLKSFFAFTLNGSPKYNTNDTLTLPINKLYNKSRLVTTVGRYIFNLFVLDDKILKFTGYINYPMNKKGISKLENQLSTLLIDDKITPTDFIDYLDRVNFLSYGCVSFLGSTITSELLIPQDKVEKRKKELANKYSKEIEMRDPTTIISMENELLDIAEGEISKLDEYEIFESGATKGGIGNSYKNIAVMQGAIKDNDRPGEKLFYNFLNKIIDKDKTPLYL